MPGRDTFRHPRTAPRCRGRDDEEDKMADEDKMDAKRKEMANKIITKLAAAGKRGDIPAQKKANKELLGHEGEATVENL